MIPFPRDAPKAKVLRALGALGFRVVRTGNHVSLVRENADGSRTPMTIPNHPRLKAATLRFILARTGVPRDAFLRAYERA